MSDNLFFSVKTGIKSIVGKDLIIDDNIAVFELVKNSYDAHAKKVIITFCKNKIIIADNGKGMSLEDVKSKWLALAYSAKKDGTEDNDLDDDLKRISYRDEIQKKRFYAGAKGIGRFSSDRLGTKLRLITKKHQEKGIANIEILDIDWTDFEKNDNVDFIKIPVNHKSYNNYDISFPDNKNHGTILEISNSNNWSRNKIIDLKHSLEKLINPFSETENFEIEIISKNDFDEDFKKDKKGKYKYSERDRANGVVQNSILDILKLKTTEISVTVDDSSITTKIIDRGVLIYKIKEKNKYHPFINSLQINLYFLNRSAKINFKNKMGIEPINYGSIFLFKNGFRVQPYGNKGDDSWGLDYRAQQGYNRFLGTRDLFGRVDIITEDSEQFKEVSSRDGGLVETAGFHQLTEIFTKKAHRRLERYVVGVLWGEGFLRNDYFNSKNEGLELRKNLLENDKDSNEFKIATSNIGSKADFIQLLKGLSNEKDIEILDYNKDLINLVDENINKLRPKFLKDLENIAETIDDDELKKAYLLADKNVKKLEKDKEAALRRAEQEEAKRKKAEEEALKAQNKAKEEEEKRKKAEEKAQFEEKKRIEAEWQKEKKEKERAIAELEKLKAQAKAKEEEEKRKSEENKNKDLSNELSIEKQKNQYLIATRKTLSDEAEQLVHSIDLYVGNASKFIEDIFNEDNDLTLNLKKELYLVKSNIDKAIKISELVIKSSFDYKNTSNKVELIQYIKEYFEVISSARESELSIVVEAEGKFLAFLSTIDIDIIIDNLVSNSIKANAEKVLVQLNIIGNELIFNYYDDGIGLSEKFIKNPQEIFSLGTRASDKKGSGIGMYDVEKRLSENKGTIKFIGNDLKLKGAGFQIKIKK
ncbi:ATP-binding protein [Chryseobacterium arthrosphaerae]|uniref:ATP-binding protein n=1 Tax=Chryseobacterium arthrosphaerae TaxID=651561 RepID=UPI001E4F59F9|nr:ATP-binding protein [Chryseobacterium arthrosphaerae]UEQ78353.1 ATP-binding protein [Chryseobacterium arthrosphaerae]